LEKEIISDVAEVLKDFFDKQDLDEIKTDSYGNVLGIMNGNRPDPCLVFDGPIDTVPVSDVNEWSKKPFGAEMKEPVFTTKKHQILRAV